MNNTLESTCATSVMTTMRSVIAFNWWKSLSCIIFSTFFYLSNNKTISEHAVTLQFTVLQISQVILLSSSSFPACVIQSSWIWSKTFSYVSVWMIDSCLWTKGSQIHISSWFWPQCKCLWWFCHMTHKEWPWRLCSPWRKGRSKTGWCKVLAFWWQEAQMSWHSQMVIYLINSTYWVQSYSFFEILLTWTICQLD